MKGMIDSIINEKSGTLLKPFLDTHINTTIEENATPTSEIKFVALEQISIIVNIKHHPPTFPAFDTHALAW